MNDKNRKIAIIIAAILGCVGLFYLGGMLGQLLGNYAAWMDSGGVSGENTMKPVSWDPLICFPAAFSGNGIKGILMILLIAGAIFAYVKLHDKFDGKQHDPRGFARSKSGIYGTASWMDEKEMKEVLEISPVPDAKGTILGEYNGKAVCMPEDTRLNRHIAVFGASGTMKSRAIIRNALFQALRRSESVIVTDSKGELYADTSEMFRNAGYDVKIYNLVSPEHSDSWNCMSDLNGDTLMAQVLTNVIIGNTSSGKGDHFWDNGEGNLLKALILLIDQDRTRSPDMKHLSAVYQLLTQNSERQLTAMFDKLPLDHPARAPFNLFAQSSDTADAVAKQAEEEQKRSQSYEALFNAYTAMQQDDLDTAALELQKVYVDTLSDSAKGIYSTISGKTGVSGIESGASDGTASADSSTDGTSEAGADAAASDGEDTQSSDGDTGEDSSYSDGGYEDSSYDDGYTE